MLYISAIVGVGLGSGIAGIAIGLAISFLYLSLRKRSRGEVSSQSSRETEPQLESSPREPLLPEYSITLYQRNLVKHLPGAMYVDNIINTIRAIYEGIWHDPFWFQDLPSPRPRLDKDALIGLVGSRHADQLLQLIESGDRTEALKAAQIIYIRSILSRLDPKGDPETTLFPPDVLRLYQALPTHVEQNSKDLYLPSACTKAPSRSRLTLQTRPRPSTRKTGLVQGLLEEPDRYYLHQLFRLQFGDRH